MNDFEGLERAGFRTNLGPDGAGLGALINERGGGFYINTPSSSLFTTRGISGGYGCRWRDHRWFIKLKSGCSIKRFIANGLALDDGTKLQADVVIFATDVPCSTAEAKDLEIVCNFGDLHVSVRLVCGKEAAQKVGSMLGMDDESELRSVWKTVDMRVFV